ncbi:hypothetical protein CH254_08275 [Rhodococcus sp. 06-412-2C]|uniref:hypothetical protein n=1 Tax=unclassified Rhodococcus (in: high G+C Gram-positive bacteria) TaxID=192944 RepID=UPI000B9BB244|nr:MULTISPECIES: hypothetical protein [unclassified Rhodococcus (in: high G+C Gram-positive bacteria)]OZC91144.1 hypothetical protein CH254_08275 [Rhodococcus sp. 06-412-2C]OZC98583.1 hypothetical protein CH279_09715 [Rhodococcus sp. 06-412-2B]
MKGSSMDDAVSAALSYFDSVDPALAADARLGWDGLVGVSPPAGPTQHSVQSFLWVYLRHAAEGPDRGVDIARALGELLDRLGRVGYADIARSAVTEELVRTLDDAAWLQKYRAATDQSGIGALDTELVTWQDAPTGIERVIVEKIGETLEVATIAGEFEPSRPGGRPLGANARAMRRRGVTDAVLTSDRGRDHSEAVLLEQLLDHRIELWSGYSAPRAELYLGLRDALHDAVEPMYGCVRRLETFIGCIGDGVALTDAGYLPDELVATIASTVFPPNERPSRIGRELDTEKILVLRRLLMRVRLLRRSAGRLVPTARTRQLSSDGLWRVLTGGIVGTGYHPDTIAAEVILARMIVGQDVADVETSADDLARLLRAEGWTHAGEAPSPEHAEPLARTLVAELSALGAVEFSEGDRTSGSHTAGSVATEEGKRLAAAVLRHRLLHTRYPSL